MQGKRMNPFCLNLFLILKKFARHLTNMGKKVK
jgi:hypothetical protein